MRPYRLVCKMYIYFLISDPSSATKKKRKNNQTEHLWFNSLHFVHFPIRWPCRKSCFFHFIFCSLAFSLFEYSTMDFFRQFSKMVESELTYRFDSTFCIACVGNSFFFRLFCFVFGDFSFIWIVCMCRYRYRVKSKCWTFQYRIEFDSILSGQVIFISWLVYIYIWKMENGQQQSNVNSPLQMKKV